MRCHRCGSVMVYERFYGPNEHFSGWRCISCGEIIDRVILENRQTKADSRNRGRRRESY
jgi:DNA-directed RNA polymerase subunit N (RpoN/RPB10)